MADTAVIYKPVELMKLLGLGRNTVYALRCAALRCSAPGESVA